MKIIKTNDITLNEKESSVTNIIATFEDQEITFKQYSFLKDRIKTYYLYLNREYFINIETQYNENSKQLLIELNIAIPNQFILKDNDMVQQTNYGFNISVQRFIRSSK